MKLKYFHGGIAEEIPLTDTKPAGKCFAVRYNNQTYYAPLVATVDAAASPLRIIFDGDALALSTVIEPHYSVLYSDGTKGTLPIADPLDLREESNVTAAVASYGGTILGSNFVACKLYGQNSSLVGGDQPDTLHGKGNTMTGGQGADTFVYSGGKNTITDYTATDKIALTANNLLDLTNTSVSGGDVIISGNDESNSLTITGGAGKSLTVIDADGDKFTLNEYGALNNDGTSIALYKNIPSDFEPTLIEYPKLKTINASAVTTAHSIKAVPNNATKLIASGTPMSLIGGDQSDTMYGGQGNTMTGGLGEDYFVHQGGHDVITDYTPAQRDRISVQGGSIYSLTGVTVGESKGITLTFGEGTVELPNVRPTSQVLFADVNNAYGIVCTFENNEIHNANGKGVTLISAGASYTIPADSSITSVMAPHGGTITADNDGAVIGGVDVTLIGGASADTFVYLGGNMSIGGFDSTDRISLASGYTIAENYATCDAGNTTINTNGGTIYINGSPQSVQLVIDNIASTIPVIDSNFDSLASDDGKHILLRNIQYVDFGKLVGEGDTPSTAPGTEANTTMVSITAVAKNHTLVGNANSNVFEIYGGRQNVLTGGLGNERYVFKKGSGGTITDFGIGTTQNGNAKTFAKKTSQKTVSTYIAYNRTNPEAYSDEKTGTGYYEGTDMLQVDGTVTAVYFEPGNTNKSRLTAYVTYKHAGGNSLIKLDNVVKRTTASDKTNIANAVYRDNETAAASLQVWDTRNGFFEQLQGDTFTGKFVTITSAQAASLDSQLRSDSA